MAFRVLVVTLCCTLAACDDDGPVLETNGAETGQDPDDTSDGPCAGLESPECEATEGCYEVWGDPFIQHPDTGEWCLEPNATVFLGCAETSTCTDLPGALCADVTFAVRNECELPDLDSCDPLAPDPSPCF